MLQEFEPELRDQVRYAIDARRDGFQSRQVYAIQDHPSFLAVHEFDRATFFFFHSANSSSVLTTIVQSLAEERGLNLVEQNQIPFTDLASSVMNDEHDLAADL